MVVNMLLLESDYVKSYNYCSKDIPLVYISIYVCFIVRGK